MFGLSFSECRPVWYLACPLPLRQPSQSHQRFMPRAPVCNPEPSFRMSIVAKSAGPNVRRLEPFLTLCRLVLDGLTVLECFEA
jgi:hypothetical protein